MKYFGFSDSTEFRCLYVGQGRIVGQKHIPRTLDEYEFFLINSGDLFIEQGGEKFHLKKGDFFLSEKNVSYGGHEPSDVDFLWLHFVVKKGDEEFTETPKFKYTIPQKGEVGEGNALVIIFSLINQYYYLVNKGAVLSSLLKALLYDLSDIATKKPVKDSRFQQVVEYFHSNPNLNEINDLKSMARFFGYNEKYFIRLFKKYVGKSPMQYLINCKINRAQLMLVNTDMTVKAIALSLNYDSYYFLKLFKKHVGMTPNQYRKTAAFDFGVLVEADKNN